MKQHHGATVAVDKPSIMGNVISSPARKNNEAADNSLKGIRGKSLCAIIPAYNESARIGSVIMLTQQYVDVIFVVDDCSTDDTAEVARLAGAHVIRHSENGGPGAALQSGYDAAIAQGFDYVVQIDGDGQHNPAHIPQMFEMIDECEMVIASRFLNKSHRDYPFTRRIGITFFSRTVSLLTRAKITDVTSGYRLVSTNTLKGLSRIQSRHWAIAQTMEVGRKGYQIREISAEMPVRSGGKSQFSLLVYGLYPFRMIPVIAKQFIRR